MAGDPVNTGTGNWTESETDIAIPFYDLALSVTRNYNASSTYSGMFGLGWSWVWDMNYNSNHEVRYADGRVVAFTYDGGESGRYTNSADFNTLQCPGYEVNNEFGTFWVDTGPCTLLTPDQYSYVFDANEKLSYVRDSYSHTISYTYAGIYCDGYLDENGCNGNWYQILDDYVSDGSRQRAMIATLRPGRF